MEVRRVVPNIKSKQVNLSRDFYASFLGMQAEMDMGWIVTMVSPTNPTTQLSILREDGSSAPVPDISVEVDDISEVHARAIDRGYQIVYPLTDEPWGVRRFFVVDPNGLVLNIMSHRQHPISQRP